MLLTEKWKLPDGTLATDFDRMLMELNNPQNHEIKIKLGLLFKAYTPGKPLELNLQAVEKKAVSTQNTKLFNLGKPKPTTKVPVPEKDKEKVDLSDLYI